MKIEFTLEAVTGRQLAEVFTSTINRKWEGWETSFHSASVLEVPLEDGTFQSFCAGRTGVLHDHDGDRRGPSWQTAWSAFRYTILNAGQDEPAVVEYDGAWRGFLAQDLLPPAVKGKTISARITGGSVYDTLPEVPLEGEDASFLVEAYGLLQGRNWRRYNKPADAARIEITAAKEAVIAGRKVDQTLKTLFGSDSVGYREAWASVQVKKGEDGDGDDKLVIHTLVPVAGWPVEIYWPLSWGHYSSAKADEMAQRIIEWATKVATLK